jgi:hypothetical protein
VLVKVKVFAMVLLYAVQAFLYAVQAFLYAFLTARYKWAPLPPGVNLLSAFYVMDKWFFERHILHATLIHYVGPSDVKVMLNRIGISADGTRVQNTTFGERYVYWGILDVAWNDAWAEARRALQLPVPTWHAPARDMVVGSNPNGPFRFFGKP